jgi:hypothetical protein
MRLRWLCGIWMLVAIPAQACVPSGWTLESLTELKAQEFEGIASDDRQALAQRLLDCLASPDPALRDGIAYEALTHWMRGGQLQVKTLRALLGRLQGMLGSTDPEGFEAPFAALVLSELARTDRIKPWLKPHQRGHLVQAAADFLAGVDDYRGFAEGEGWRHGVAHGADLALQLIVNPEVTRAQVDQLVRAVLTQIVPAHAHFYRFGEPERLARPILFAASRGLHSSEELQQWISGLMNPAPLGAWSDAFASERGLAKRHNTMAFLLVAYANASLGTDEKMRALTPMLADALKQLP